MSTETLVVRIEIPIDGDFWVRKGREKEPEKVVERYKILSDLIDETVTIGMDIKEYAFRVMYEYSRPVGDEKQYHEVYEAILSGVWESKLIEKLPKHRELSSFIKCPRKDFIRLYKDAHREGVSMDE